MSFLVKRDITTTNPPASDQVEVGELVLNCNTGILYTKLLDGTVVKFLSSSVVETVLPTITFSDVSEFCCDGDTLDVTVSNLTIGESYSYEFIDLNQNSVSFGTSTGSLTPTTADVRSISVLMSISGSQSNSLVKFALKQNSTTIAESVVTICCTDCQTEPEQPA